MSTSSESTSSRERTDFLQTLSTHRGFLRHTVRDLTDEQASERPTSSALCLGGLIKHVSEVESGWADFIVRGPAAMSFGDDGPSPQEWANRFSMLPGESIAGLLEQYAEVARRTDELVATLPDLDASHPLPEAPWFEKGARWSARRTLLHIIAETAQHAGHADIIRETIDGSKTMG
jgi:uncharacterized damage-inducible protein DinB